MSVRWTVCHTPVLCLNDYTYPHFFSPSGSFTILLFPHQTGWCVLFAPSGECYIAYGRKIAYISTVRPWRTENSTQWMSIHVDGQLHFLLRDAVHKRGLCRCAVSVRLYCVEAAKDMQCEWKTIPRFQMVPFSVTFSGLVKYSLTRSIARPLCNSWVSCCAMWGIVV